jgi:hypothetical protein
MSRQFLRKVSLIVGGNDFMDSDQETTDSASGTTTTFSESTAIEFGAQTESTRQTTGGGFSIEFKVRRGDIQTPNTLDARIWNLSPKTANKISTREFTQVALQAGYDGNFGLIFRGVIKQVRIGRVDGKDSYVDITAADGDELYNYAPISDTMAAGSTVEDLIARILQNCQQLALKQTITQGYKPELPASGRIRGRVLYGMSKDELRDICAAYNIKWSIQDGKLVLIPLTSYIPGKPVVVSSRTGLIGVPEQTQNGIECRVLLNPQIKIGQLIQLEGDINRARLGVGINANVQNQTLQNTSKIAASGQYYVMYAEHAGATRSPQPWYSDLVCLAVDAQLPQSVAAKTVVQPESGTIRLN